MEVLHKTEKPGSRILASLLETFPSCTSNLLTDSISTDSLNTKFALFRGEPSSLRRVIRE
jgi:hypothetical protein